MNLKFQKRIAASILKCGERRVTLYAGKDKFIKEGTSREAIRKFIASRIIYKKDVNATSRGRFRKHSEAKMKGRHSGFGKRKGARDARNPSKINWINRIRAQRKMIHMYRDDKKITPSQHCTLLSAVKGNQFKNKRIMIEFVINMREEAKRVAIKEAETKLHAAKDLHVNRKKAAKIAATKVAGK